MADGPSLSVVLPVYNGEGWVHRSLSATDAAIRRAGFSRAEIIVVDDGSTDGTVDEAKNTPLETPLRVVSQSNAGRFLARRRGLDEASGDYILFVDSRVLLDEGSLEYVVPLLDDRSSQVWTAHVEAATEGNPIARFWRGIEHIAWRRYHGRPRHVQYGIDEFDWYPKGTTALLCPRPLITEAYDAFTPTVADLTRINDDTALLRFVARDRPMNISPDYSCVYHARTTLRGFLRHAHHRGAVLIDGYLHPGARFSREIAAVLAVSPVLVIVGVRHPKLAAAALAGGPVATAIAARALGADKEDAAVMGALAVPFGVAYLGGMWRGFLSRLQMRFGAARVEGSAP
jgi:glycosyltransferase involved in cell wall biosynthesis